MKFILFIRNVFLAVWIIGLAITAMLLMAIDEKLNGKGDSHV